MIDCLVSESLCISSVITLFLRAVWNNKNNESLYIWSVVYILFARSIKQWEGTTSFCTVNLIKCPVLIDIRRFLRSELLSFSSSTSNKTYNPTAITTLYKYRLHLVIHPPHFQHAYPINQRKNAMLELPSVQWVEPTPLRVMHRVLPSKV